MFNMFTLVIAAYYLAIGHINFAAGDCLCSSGDATRRLMKKKDVKFEKASFGGKEFQRPRGASKLHRNDEYLDTYSADNSCPAEQIHLTLGDTYGSVIISYATFSNFTVDSAVTYYSSGQAPTVVEGQAFSYSQVMFVKTSLYEPYMGAPESTPEKILARQDTQRWAYVESSGVHWSNWYNVTTVQLNQFPYNNPYGIYNSPLLHTVTLSGLTPGVTYYYTVSGSCIEYEFVIPVQYPAATAYPMTIGLMGDVGQTEVSAVSVSALQALDPSVVFLVGDLSYADGWAFLWDSFGAMIEPLAAQYPLLTTGGNHEVDNGENWLSYITRYPTAYRGSGSTHPCYWAREVGVMNVIALCSYASFTNSSLQYRWLSKYLRTSIDRTRTPWVVVMMHIPFYNSNWQSHWMEGELMRRAIEPLLYEYGVDIVLSGHVHAYERMHPVFNNTINPCGPTYINIGDGGNYEGWATTWVNNTNASSLGEGYSWSAFREDSFGVGEIVFANDTFASFNWHRHACGSDNATAYFMNFTAAACVSPQDNSAQKMLSSDSVNILRLPSNQCPNRYVSTATSTSSNSKSNNSFPGGIIAVIVVFGVFALFGTYFVLSLSGGKKNDMDESLVNKSVQITNTSSSANNSV